MSGNQPPTAATTTSAPLNWLSWANFQNINHPGSRNTTAMPSPHYMPFPATQWNMNTMPWKMPAQNGDGIVHYFTAEVPNSHNSNQLRPNHQHKRKSDLTALM